MREFVVLAKAEMVNWFGRNVYRNTKDPAERKRRAFLRGTIAVLLVVALGYVAGGAYGLILGLHNSEHQLVFIQRSKLRFNGMGEQSCQTVLCSHGIGFQQSLKRFQFLEMEGRILLGKGRFLSRAGTKQCCPKQKQDGSNAYDSH